MLTSLFDVVFEADPTAVPTIVVCGQCDATVTQAASKKDTSSNDGYVAALVVVILLVVAAVFTLVLVLCCWQRLHACCW